MITGSVTNWVGIRGFKMTQKGKGGFMITGSVTNWHDIRGFMITGSVTNWHDIRGFIMKMTHFAVLYVFYASIRR